VGIDVRRREQRVAREQLQQRELLHQRAQLAHRVSQRLDTAELVDPSHERLPEQTPRHA
jgi:hypothetical protein